MNRSELFEILQKLDSLSTYGELLPSDFKTRYSGDITELKKKINEAGTEITEPILETKQFTANASPLNISATSDSIQLPPEIKRPSDEPPLIKATVPANLSIAPPSPKPAIPPPPPLHKPPPPPLFTATGTFNIKKIYEMEKRDLENSGQTGPANLNTAKPGPGQPGQEHFTFMPVLESLLPILTDEGKSIKGDLSLPLDLYKILKIIDDKINLHELYIMHGHNYKNFLEFLTIFHQLEMDKYLYFSKTKEVAPNKGWIRLGEIFSQGNITSDEKVNQAATLQKTKKGMFIGEALLELEFINDVNLRDGLKLQRWIAKLSENSSFIKIQGGNNQSDSSAENKRLALLNNQAVKAPVHEQKSFSNIFNFIIPMFNDKGLEILEDPERKELASRLAIIDGESSLLKIFEANKESFKNNRLIFLKFIIKLDSQKFLFYKKNIDVEERDVWVKYGELLISLGLITETQLTVALSFRLGNEKMRGMFLGETLAELKIIEPETLEECLKIHKWFNEILAKISYENAFVDAIESVLQDTFNTPVDIGGFKRMAFTKPLSGMICIIYPIHGKLNGKVYYILDRAFMNNLTKTLMASFGMQEGELDSSIVTEISNMITGSSLTRLSNIGISCETSLPEILMDQEIIIADKKPISVIPLMTEMGRFAVGLEISE